MQKTNSKRGGDSLSYFILFQKKGGGVKGQDEIAGENRTRYKSFCVYSCC